MKYSMRDLICDVSYYTWATWLWYGSCTTNDVIAPSCTSSP